MLEEDEDKCSKKFKRGKEEPDSSIGAYLQNYINTIFDHTPIMLPCHHTAVSAVYLIALLSLSCFALDLFKCENAYHFSSSGPCYREQVIHGKDRLCVVQAMSSHHLLCFTCTRHYSRYLRRREVMQLSSGHVDIRSKCSLELGGGTTGV